MHGLFCWLPLALAADVKPASERSGDESVPGLLSTPAGKGPFPALVVVHKYWGLNDSGKEQASNLADQSYASLAVDRDRGKVATRPDMAHALMRGVPEDRGQRDLHAAVIDYGSLGLRPSGRGSRGSEKHPRSRP